MIAARKDATAVVVTYIGKCILTILAFIATIYLKMIFIKDSWYIKVYIYTIILRKRCQWCMLMHQIIIKNPSRVIKVNMGLTL